MFVDDKVLLVVIKLMKKDIFDFDLLVLVSVLDEILDCKLWCGLKSKFIVKLWDDVLVKFCEESKEKLCSKDCKCL